MRLLPFSTKRNITATLNKTIFFTGHFFFCQIWHAHTKTWWQLYTAPGRKRQFPWIISCITLDTDRKNKLRIGKNKKHVKAFLGLLVNSELQRWKSIKMSIEMSQATQYVPNIIFTKIWLKTQHLAELWNLKAVNSTAQKQCIRTIWNILSI